MIDTNALVAIALSMIASFTNKVHIPQGCAPQTTNDIEEVRIGSPHLNTDIYIKDKLGDSFFIQGGVVSHFTAHKASALTTTELANLKIPTNPALNSNTIVTIARETVNALIKRGGPLGDAPARLNYLPDTQFNGMRVVQVSWQKQLKQSGSLKMASIDIDNITGCVVALRLADSSFMDIDAEHKMHDSVYTNEHETINKPVNTMELKHPTNEQVCSGITNWMVMCHYLGINCGPKVCIAEVDWKNTVLASDRKASETEKICYIAFNNGANICAYKDSPYSFAFEDTCYNATFQERKSEDWSAFEGTVKLKWESIAATFESRIRALFALAHYNMPATRNRRFYGTPAVNEQGLVRTMIECDRAAEPGGDPEPLYTIECDLETGQIKSMTIIDSEMIHNLAAALTSAANCPGTKPKTF